MLNKKLEAHAKNSIIPETKGKTIQQVSESAGIIEPVKCPMCDSNEWTGYLKCSKCSGYYLQGKCLKCDHLRMEKCPIDDGEFMFISENKDSEGGKTKLDL